MYLDRFLELQRWSPTACEEPGPGQGPDFVLTVSGCRVGIEVTQLFRDSGTRKGSESRQRERRRERFLARLCRAYYEGGGPPALVKVHYEGIPRDEWIPAWVDQILVARPALPWDLARLDERQYEGTPLTIWVTALPTTAGNYARWQYVTNAIGWTRAVTTEELRAEVARKGRRLEAYLRAAPEIVLLIVADHTSASGMLDLSSVSSKLDPHGFADVYVLCFPIHVVQIA